MAHVSTAGVAFRRLIEEAALEDNNAFNSAYPEALIASGEAQRNKAGYAGTKSRERGAFWNLYNAQVHGEGLLVKAVERAAAAAAAAAAEAQP